MGVSSYPSALGISGFSTFCPVHRSLRQHERYQLLYKTKGSAFGQQKSFELSEGESAESVIQGALENYLHQEGVTDVIPFGCYDATCVLYTAEDAYRAGFEVHYDKDLNIASSKRSLESSNMDYKEFRREAYQSWERLKIKNPPKLNKIPHRQSKCTIL